MKMKLLNLVVCTFLVFGTGGLTRADARDSCDDDQGRHSPKKHWKEDRHEADRGRSNHPYFRDGDADLIRRHRGVRHLPPGLQAKLYRTGYLPPGWEKKVRPLPILVEHQLPPVCYGCRRGIIGNCAIVFNPQDEIDSGCSHLRPLAG